MFLLCLIFYQITVNTNSYQKLIKIQVKNNILRFTGCFLSIKSFWNSFCFFIAWLYNFITHNFWIIWFWIIYLLNVFLFTIVCSRMPNLIFYPRIDIYRHSAIDWNYIFFHQIYIYICVIYALLMFLIDLFL